VAVNQVVFQADVEPRFSGVSLAPCAATQLVVDAARFMPVRSQDEQAVEATTRFAIAFVAAAQAISVPRPAMFVEIVTTPGAPASATTVASSASFRR